MFWCTTLTLKTSIVAYRQVLLSCRLDSWQSDVKTGKFASGAHGSQKLWAHLTQGRKEMYNNLFYSQHHPLCCDCVKTFEVELRDVFRSFDTVNGVHELKFHPYHDVMTAACRDGTVFFFDVAPMLDYNKPPTLTGLVPNSKLQSVLVLPSVQKGGFAVLSMAPLNSTLLISEIGVKGRYGGKDNVPTIFTEFTTTNCQESRDLRGFVTPIFQLGLKPVPPKAVDLETIFVAHAFGFAWHPLQPLFAVLAPNKELSGKITRSNTASAIVPSRRSRFFFGGNRASAATANDEADPRQQRAATRSLTLSIYKLTGDDAEVEFIETSFSSGEDHVLHIFPGPLLGVVKYVAPADAFVPDIFPSGATTILGVRDEKLILGGPLHAVHILDLSNRLLQCAMLVTAGNIEQAAQLAQSLCPDATQWLGTVFEAFGHAEEALRLLPSLSLGLKVNMCIKHTLLEPLSRLLNELIADEHQRDSSNLTGSSLFQRSCIALHRGGMETSLKQLGSSLLVRKRYNDAIFVASLLQNDEQLIQALGSVPQKEPLVVIDEPLTVSAGSSENVVERSVFHPIRGSIVNVKGDTLEELDVVTGALLCHITFDLLAANGMDIILPAGPHYVVGLFQGRYFVVWDLDEAVLLSTSDIDKVHSSRRVTALATSLCVDRWLFFAAEGSNNVRVTRVDYPGPAREILRKSSLRGGSIVSLAYSTEHHLLSSGCNDGTIQVWSISTEEPETTGSKKNQDTNEFATPQFAVQLTPSSVISIVIGVCTGCGTNAGSDKLFLAAAYQNRRVDVIAMSGQTHTCVASTTL
ncbi:hypothetical protein JM16_002922 [Phytophthora kernoviae]|uniref:BEACH domain-containing protein n=2 Tax=Phytophthora kernoviae TaxID=325452 RepID=A0A8T0M655_9STRA|nr:hypothetical protein JM16_002922 [Phytophthora kernoviae]